jgi:saccharopine dehydrogenase-like NADP-dependent oxidoreductase
LNILILGGTGRIGSSIARDLVTHTQAEVAIAGRRQEVGERICRDLGPQASFLHLDLSDRAGLQQAISASQLVVHCAGPFHHRDTTVLELCIDRGANYLDVSDSRDFTRRILALNAAAQSGGITAIVNSGVFPGISNSLVRLAAEQLDEPQRIHLSYVVSGSGGAGLTVMRTTFLGLQHPFPVWRENRWQQIQPYSDREAVDFPAPYGRAAVYWFDVPETETLPQSFPVRTVTTKFGSVPDLYNHLTWLMAHGVPKRWLQAPSAIEFLSRVSYAMTEVTDRLTGIGVAMRADIVGRKQERAACSRAMVLHANTAIAAGAGSGSIAELLLAKQLVKPGVWPVERVLSTERFLRAMQSRNINIPPPEIEWL